MGTRRKISSVEDLFDSCVNDPPLSNAGPTYRPVTRTTLKPAASDMDWAEKAEVTIKVMAWGSVFGTTLGVSAGLGWKMTSAFLGLFW